MYKFCGSGGCDKIHLEIHVSVTAGSRLKRYEEETDILFKTQWWS